MAVRDKREKSAKTSESFNGPSDNAVQFTELGIDCEANALDQGTPALQFNLRALQLIGNGASERNQTHNGQGILHRFVFEGCIDRCVGRLQNIGGRFGGRIEAKPLFNGQLRETLLGKGGHIGHKG